MEYRAEVDGLRAVAIIPVILFHAGFPLFSGGFVGVDVFFVISGYLITTIILTEKEQGTFSLIHFYERRARRILPALFLVMLVSLPFAWLWLQPADLKDFSQSLIAVSTFSSNILFWKESGYWGAANELKPLLHTWSLAVEEQYYVLFPLYLALMWRFRKRWILSSFLIIAAISLAIAQWGAYYRPVATFFLLPTRGWELAIGASIAFYFLYRKSSIRSILRHEIIDEILGVVGLFMIGYSVFIYDETTPFPSLYSLLPTVGTGLIILFSSSKTIVGRLLGNQLLVGLGLISYSVYLWHQPLFAFARHRSQHEPGLLIYSGLSVLSILLAFLSWHFVEKAFRKKGIFSGRGVLFFTLFGTVFFIIVGLVGYYKEGFPNRFSVKQSVLNDFKGHNLRADCDIQNDGKGWGKKICVIGDKAKDTQIGFAVFGDSHSSALLPAFDTAVRLLNGNNFVHLGLGGCPPLLGVDVVNGNFEVGVCEDLSSRQFEFVKNNRINRVFLIARWSLYTDGEYVSGMKKYFLVNKNSHVLTKDASRSVFESALKYTIDAYISIGVHVYIVEQVPQQKIDAKKLYFHLSKLRLNDNELEETLFNQSVLRERSDKLQSYNRKVFKSLALERGVTIINLDNIYCDLNICLIGDRNHTLFRDYHHISKFGANQAVGELIKHIR